MIWKIWYVNNVTVTGYTQEEWASAPSEGVLAITAYYGNDAYGRKLNQIWSGSDWYWMINGQIYQSLSSADEPNIWLENPAPAEAVSKSGKWTTNEEMLAVENAILEWIN
jgi:hypothetical protein